MNLWIGKKDDGFIKADNISTKESHIAAEAGGCVELRLVRNHSNRFQLLFKADFTSWRAARGSGDYWPANCSLMPNFVTASPAR